MANIAAYAQKAMLDWTLGGAAATQPTSRYLALGLGAPSSISASELGTGSGYTRQTAVFAAAVSPAGSATLNSAVTFGPFSSAQSITGLVLFDTQGSSNTGNMLWYGTLTTPRTVAPGDQLVIAAGSLLITLA
jgi:hypothetical protein